MAQLLAGLVREAAALRPASEIYGRRPRPTAVDKIKAAASAATAAPGATAASGAPTAAAAAAKQVTRPASRAQAAWATDESTVAKNLAKDRAAAETRVAFAVTERPEVPNSER